jgi:hypothetical protein
LGGKGAQLGQVDGAPAIGVPPIDPAAERIQALEDSLCARAVLPEVGPTSLRL